MLHLNHTRLAVNSRNGLIETCSAPFNPVVKRSSACSYQNLIERLKRPVTQYKMSLIEAQQPPQVTEYSDGDNIES